MSNAPKGARRVPWRGSTILVITFLVATILPAFIAFALTPPDANVVSSVQAWNGCAYSVRRGDNLFRIGVRYGVSYQYLAQLNGIYNPNYIVVGQTISVPCGPVPYPNYRPSYGAGYPPYQCPWCKPFQKPDNCGATVQYTVQPGDNLFRIAVNNGSTIQWIRTDNDLWGKVLRPGMTLNVPCQNYVHYGSNVLTPGATGQTIVTETPLPTAVPSDRIRMRNGQFNPAQKTVKVGSTVTWFNAEPAGGPAYDINSGQPGQPDGNFTSGGLVQPGGQFQFTFTTAGSYPYFSTTNPTMTGEIIVQP